MKQSNLRNWQKLLIIFFGSVAAGLLGVGACCLGVYFKGWL